MATDSTTQAAALKQHYYGTERTIKDLTYGESPAYALIEKDEDFGGSSGELPIIHGHNQGQSAAFGTAQANVGNLKIKRWSMTNVTHYGVAQITGQLIRQSRGNANAYLKYATAEIDGTFKGAARRYGVDLFRAGWGDVGNISATQNLALTVVTLTNPEDVMNFEVDQWLKFSGSQNSALLRGTDGANRLQVTARDEDAGTITLNAALNSIAAGAGGVIAVSDFIFIEGDRQNSATPTRQRMAGFEAWVPFNASDLTGNFWAVDRTIDKTRLGGRRLDGTTMNIEEAMTKALVLSARGGGKPDYIFISYTRWLDLENSMGSKKVYADVEKGGVGFRALTIQGPKGPVQVMADSACPVTRAFAVQLDTWSFMSMGKPIGFLDEDDLQMLRQSASDGYEVRIGGYFQLGCKAPGFNVCVQL
jgi:hypothetical protein